MNQINQASEDAMNNQKAANDDDRGIGRKVGEGTLWDQDVQEETLKVLVEEAKVNLCLRLLIDFRAWQSNRDIMELSIRACLQREPRLDTVAIDSLLVAFEECMGQVLAWAFLHVETMQLTEIPMLVTHVSTVLQSTKHHRLFDRASFQAQEMLAPTYYWFEKK